MSDTQSFATNETVNEASTVQDPGQIAHPRAVGSPLPIGSGSLSSSVGALSEPLRGPTPPPPGRGLASPSSMTPLDVPSGVQRAVSAIRAALPFVQRILPLLDGNIGTAVSNLLSPHHRLPPPPPPPPPVNLAPIENGLAELQTQQRELRNQVVEQNSSLKRVEDQLEMVREATDRNTLEQQELLEDLKGVGNKLNLFALIAMGLLALSVLLNIILYLHILRVLP
jgi:hypothetical protein